MARKTIPLICQYCRETFHRRPRGESRRNRFCSNRCSTQARWDMNKLPIVTRFLQYVAKGTECWLWTGSKNDKGYGMILINRQSRAAHRIAYELWIGPIPDGLMVCHHCDQPACVNPAHLFVGTNADNMRDMVMKDRRGQKLTRAQVDAIRNDPRVYRVIASEYGISESYISQLKHRDRRPL